MENGLRMNTPTGALDFDEPEPWFDTSRRSFLRAAGLFRLQQKARRWFWRGQIAGEEQAGGVKFKPSISHLSHCSSK